MHVMREVTHTTKTGDSAHNVCGQPGPNSSRHRGLGVFQVGQRGTDSLNLGRVWESVNAPVQVAYPTTQSAKTTVCHGNCQNFYASYLVDAVPLLEATGQ